MVGVFKTEPKICWFPTMTESTSQQFFTFSFNTYFVEVIAVYFFWQDQISHLPKFSQSKSWSQHKQNSSLLDSFNIFNSGHYITNPNIALLKPIKGKSLEITIDLHQVWSPQQNKTPKQMIPSNPCQMTPIRVNPIQPTQIPIHRDTNLAASSTTEQFTNASTIHPKVTEDGWMPFSCINFQVDLWQKMLQGDGYISHRKGKGKSSTQKCPFLGDIS